MSELFRGLKNMVDPGGKPQRDLDDMLDAYAKGGKGHKAAAEGMRDVMRLSPDLKERVLEAVRDGYLTRFSPENPGDNAAAGYNAHSRTMHVRPQFNRSDAAYAELMFVMGHEIDHARSLKGRNQAERVLFPEVEKIAKQESQGPRDYTNAIESYVQAQRTEEAQANIGGFNAMASYALIHGGAKKGKELETIYELDPVRMGDFIRKSGDPAQYALRGGLEVDRNFHMPKSEDNIEAMKCYYADKMINDDYMAYRQEAIKLGVTLVNAHEKAYGEGRFEDRQYVIDPERLHAHASLNLPEDGRYEFKGAVQMRSLSELGIDLGSLGSMVPENQQQKQEASSSVTAVPTKDDHPLFAQALVKYAECMVNYAEYTEKYKLGKSPQEIRNAAAALAFAAQERGLTQIEGVIPSQKVAGIIATQGSGTAGQNALVEVSGMSVDERVNLAKLAPVPVQVSQPQSQQESLVQNSSGGSQKL